jgi:hypothetical protein
VQQDVKIPGHSQGHPAIVARVAQVSEILENLAWLPWSGRRCIAENVGGRILTDWARETTRIVLTPYEFPESRLRRHLEWLDGYDPDQFNAIQLKYAVGRIASRRRAAKGPRRRASPRLRSLRTHVQRTPLTLY